MIKILDFFHQDREKQQDHPTRTSCAASDKAQRAPAADICGGEGCRQTSHHHREGDGHYRRGQANGANPPRSSTRASPPALVQCAGRRGMAAQGQKYKTFAKNGPRRHSRAKRKNIVELWMSYPLPPLIFHQLPL